MTVLRRWTQADGCQTGARDLLHELARRVERLGVGGHTDPEATVVTKLTVAHELRRLARKLGP